MNRGQTNCGVRRSSYVVRSVAVLLVGWGLSNLMVDEGLGQPPSRPVIARTDPKPTNGTIQPAGRITLKPVPISVSDTKRRSNPSSKAWQRVSAETETGPSLDVPTISPPKMLANLAPNGGQTATVHLEKVGPPSVKVGQPLTYEIHVRNPGTVPLYQVRVQDELPPGTRFLNAEPHAQVAADRLGWDLGTLDVGGVRKLVVTVQPNSNEEFHSAATATFSTTSGLRAKMTRPQLALTKTGPKSASVGETITFQLLVSNTGSGPATNVVLQDRLPSELEHPVGSFVEADVGTLLPGETRTVPIEVKVVRGGQITNQAVALGEEGLQASAQTTIAIAEPGLQLRKTGPKGGSLFRDLEHRLEVTNPGTGPAKNVRVTDQLPEGLEFVGCSTGGKFDATTRNCEWDVGTVAPKQTVQMSLTFRARVPGEYVNRAVAVADRRLEAKAEAPFAVEGVAALLLESVDLDDPIEVGAETTYEIRVVNQGNRPCLNVGIVANLPEGLEAVNADGPGPHQLRGDRVRFEPIAKLAARADALFRVKVRGKRDGKWRMRVEMTCDQLDRPVFEEESTTVYDDFRSTKPEP
jgi:uncharacterized repeat protein (TIGR01451 family)